MAVLRLQGNCLVRDQVVDLPPRASALASIPLNTDDISADVLNIENKTRSNPFPWKGQFSPQFIQAMLEKYAEPGMTICDPFLGSGTVMGEAGRLGLAAVGAEINPAAYHMARMYRFANVSQHDRASAIHAVSALLHDAFPRSLPLLGAQVKPCCSDEIESKLCDLRASTTNSTHKALLEALIVLLDLWKPGLDERRLYAVWHTLTRQVTTLPFSKQRIRVVNCDARNLPVDDLTVDLVLTSPPYINVHNYHQQYRRSAEVLGWHLLTVARSEIGSNRRNRGNRFLTVIQYSQDIALALKEMRRICRPPGRIIMVLGRESTVRGTRFFNGDIVVRLARCAGLHVDMRQERVFRNRFGDSIYEDILHLIRGSQSADDPVRAATQISREVLHQAMGDTSDNSRSDLQAAIMTAESVKPSTFYRAHHNPDNHQEDM